MIQRTVSSESSLATKLGAVVVGLQDALVGADESTGALRLRKALGGAQRHLVVDAIGLVVHRALPFLDRGSDGSGRKGGKDEL